MDQRIHWGEPMVKNTQPNKQPKQWRIYVEGGGNKGTESNNRSDMRQGFKKFFENCGLIGNIRDEHLHLMVQTMENWFLADIDALEKYFGDGFQRSSIPATSRGVENINKQEVEGALKNAAKNTKKKEYHKGRDSHLILSSIDPRKITPAFWFERLLQQLT